MDNFTYHNNTKIIFGKETQHQVGKEVALHAKKVLLHYGGSSIKKSGLYADVKQSLLNEGIEIYELGGVVANPRLSLVRKGIKIAQDNTIDLVLAVGGGSVIDSAKAIAAGALYDGDVWDFYSSKTKFTKGLRLATILTLPATGSEGNDRSVITNDESQEKRSSILMRPTFSILNAELCATLPRHQVANGVVDMLAHLFERYFTTSDNVEISDRQIEAVMKTIIDLGYDVYTNPADYDKYAQIMWAATIAHNHSLCVGRTTDWATHQIEHELSGMYDVAHGAGLAVLFPAWMKYIYHHNPKRFAMLFTNVFNIELDFFNLEKTILKGIDALQDFYKKLDMPLTLRDLNIPESDIEQLALNATRNNTISQGVFVKLDTQDIINILNIAK